MELTPDAIIVTEAYFLNIERGDIVFVTDDVNCYNIAKRIFHLKTATLNSIANDIYKGYITISGSVEEINEQMNSLDYSKLYENEYVIINNTTDSKSTEMRFDGQNLVALKLPPSKVIKGLNSHQRCALDALNNKDIPIVALLGESGSGKTALALRSALYKVKEKGEQSTILGVREARGEGAQVGYLPGEFLEKTGDFFRPLEQQLDGGDIELERLRQQGVIQTQIPYYLKGTTYNEAIAVVDEAEDLTESQIKLIGTRMGKNSRIFFSGDYKQSLLGKNTSNPLVKMCEELKGNPLFACVYLEEDVRSEASKTFTTLFE